MTPMGMAATREKRLKRRTVFWVFVYLALAVTPLVVLAAIPDLAPPRGFWMELSSALGFVGLAMLCLQFVLTARFRGVGAPHGLDTIIQFHREAGLVAVAFVLLHPVIMLMQAPAYLEFLNPAARPGTAVLLIGAILALLAIVFLTFFRERLGIPYEWWRLTHGLLGSFVVTAGLIHVLNVEWYVARNDLRTLWMVTTIAALALLFYLRIVTPLRMRRHPCTVLEVRKVGARTWSLVLAPGLRFRAGQFAWLTLGRTPFSMQQHPFSISSSALQNDRIEFTIRELGDFTSTIGDVAPGTRAFVEGPYGAFTPSPESRALVLVAGGVGIAPMMSILRTMSDGKDRRAVLLLYASPSDEVLFRQEFEELSAGLNLRVIVHEAGPITPAALTSCLSSGDSGNTEYFICGPGGMMDMVEEFLLRSGVRPVHIHTERFDIA
jgi:predicted ferric reductase